MYLLHFKQNQKQAQRLENSQRIDATNAAPRVVSVEHEKDKGFLNGASFVGNTVMVCAQVDEAQIDGTLKTFLNQQASPAAQTKRDEAKPRLIATDKVFDLRHASPAQNIVHLTTIDAAQAQTLEGATLNGQQNNSQHIQVKDQSTQTPVSYGLVQQPHELEENVQARLMGLFYQHLNAEMAKSNRPLNQQTIQFALQKTMLALKKERPELTTERRGTLMYKAFGYHTRLLNNLTLMIRRAVYPQQKKTNPQTSNTQPASVVTASVTDSPDSKKRTAAEASLPALAVVKKNTLPTLSRREEIIKALTEKKSVELDSLREKIDSISSTQGIADDRYCALTGNELKNLVVDFYEDFIQRNGHQVGQDQFIGDASNLMTIIENSMLEADGALRFKSNLVTKDVIYAVLRAALVHQEENQNLPKYVDLMDFDIAKKADFKREHQNIPM